MPSSLSVLSFSSRWCSISSPVNDDESIEWSNSGDEDEMELFVVVDERLRLLDLVLLFASVGFATWSSEEDEDDDESFRSDLSLFSTLLFEKSSSIRSGLDVRSKVKSSKGEGEVVGGLTACTTDAEGDLPETIDSLSLPDVGKLLIESLNIERTTRHEDHWRSMKHTLSHYCSWLTRFYPLLPANRLADSRSMHSSIESNSDDSTQPSNGSLSRHVPFPRLFKRK